MNFRIVWERADSGDRAQSAVIGYVLLVLLTVAAVSTMLVMGGQAVSDLEGQAEVQRAESAFTQLDAKAAMVALGETEAQSVNLGIEDEGNFRTEYTGTVTITQRLPNGTDVNVLDQRLGKITYRKNGETLAYQGGGVWRGTGEETTMVSPPELHYRGETLTLPIVAVSPGEHDPRQLTVRKKHDSVRVGPGQVQNSVMVVTIQSEYYMGWKTFFEERVENSQVSVDHDDQTITAELGRVKFEPKFDNALLGGGGDVWMKKPGDVNGPVVATGDVRAKNDDNPLGDDEIDNYPTTKLPANIDGIVGSRLDQAGDPEHTDLGPMLSGGTAHLKGGETYYVTDNLDLTQRDLEIDLTDGNVTLLVPGNVDSSKGDIHVKTNDATNPRGSFRMFVGGNMWLKNGGYYVDTKSTTDEDSRHLQIFGTSTMQVGVQAGSKTWLEGVLYAPRTEDADGENPMITGSKCSLGDHHADICITKGTPTIDGAIVAGSMKVDTSAQVNYDTSLNGLDMVVHADDIVAPPLSFLHISVNTVTVDGPFGVGATATPPTPNNDVVINPGGGSGGDDGDGDEEPEDESPDEDGDERSIDFTMERHNHGYAKKLDASAEDEEEVVRFSWSFDSGGYSLEDGQSHNGLEVDAGTNITLTVKYEDGTTVQKTKTV